MESALDLAQAGLVLGSAVVGGAISVVGNYALQRRNDRLSFRGYARLLATECASTSGVIRHWLEHDRELMTKTDRSPRIWQEHEALFAQHLNRADLAEISVSMSWLDMLATSGNLREDPHDEQTAEIASEAARRLLAAAATLRKYS